MGRQEKEAGLRLLESCIERSRQVMDGWLQFNQLLCGYPQAPPEQRGAYEMQFLNTKSELARRLSVLAGNMRGDCAFETPAINVIAGTPSLDQVYAQSEVAVKKLQTEWHRVYIEINETLGEMEDLRRRVYAGERVVFARLVCRVVKPLPWKKIFAVSGAAATVLLVAGGIYFMRNFLGFWAPGAGEGVVVDANWSDEEQVTYMLGRMKAALESHDLDTVMTAFADDFQAEVEGGPGDKTALRALLMTYKSTLGFGQVSMDIDGVEMAFDNENGSGSLGPVTIDTPQGKVDLLIRGRRAGDAWLITSMAEY